ncbi:hypothetical protein PPL_08011 [Heterostelium album PN500]|uniref:Phytanoyl-CoA dioxygenase n=1 Tax=Heterostelium pallidum (strain ATCC 26659 / Pp 5 / PN500) TaxID=670386 RepID=D3BHK8_HETP5|nr:hypothetical protein PPL_08011 [Heterostelium album PN500]EFA79185.1 hypothetical protein PPL_08011 [Heterostelium album PN500]|eukprot:XP_020431306.1 hypothetical protein PPL_08011 [Heterostelium album PN500]
MKLTSEQVKQFNEQGYLIVPNFVPDNEIDEIRNEMSNILTNMNIEDEINNTFQTNEQDRNSNKYFLESGDKICYFFEPDAIKDKKLVVDKGVALNKIGHALHDLNPVFEKFSYHQRIKDLINSLDFYKKPLSVQSMYIFKNPKIGGEVGIHQDSTFLHTSPLTTIGLWFAFEDAIVANGCLRGLPGSHKNGINRRFIRDKDGSGALVFDPKENTDNYDKKDFVALECKKGSVILLDGAVVHYSEPNTSNISRHAYTLHFIEGDGSAVYESNNWLQRPDPALPFREL